MTSSKLKSAFILCLSAVVAGCATAPVSPTREVVTETKAPERQLTARDLYRLAANYQAEPQQFHLLKAAEQAVNEQDYLLALAISENLKQSAYPLIRQRNQLILLKAYLATAQNQSLNQLLEQTTIDGIAEADRASYLWLSAQYLSSQQRSLAAARNLLQLQQYPASAQNTEIATLLWQHLTMLSDSELESLRGEHRYPAIGWIELAQLSRQHIGQSEALQQALADWHQRYPMLPATEQLPEAAQQLFALTPYQPQRIAVLLPLNGQFRPHAQAIQFGILSAASARQQTALVFIDSQQSTEAMAQQVAQAQADFVIGPLLKDQVDRVSQSNDWQWPTLFLNSKDNNLAAKPEQFYFALSMEDEAVQMAQLFMQKNYRKPVVISSNHSISVRMQQHFARQWQQLGNPAPEMHNFNSKQDLESLISRLLETDRSRERVKQMNSLISQTLEVEPHSRLDIDAIYVIADPVQTQLFKPFVDVSVSQTAPRIPVYASSRSHSTSLDSTEQRDLNGLTFTEMPWMLSDKHSAELRQQYKQLFPDQDETLQRLFAMGYDAYQLVGSLKQQQTLPSTIFPGLTGQLRLDVNGSIVRRLSWAQYRNNRLRPVQEP
ncbi:MAG TPA: penicillin-binding protein activator [Rheinheimera sp.]|nr:penicillin-binding protein activator [Rheinheimera sp.]